MNTMALPIVESLKFTGFIMELVTGDLSDADARRRARDSEGPSISWIVGHLGHYRALMMELLGHQVSNPFAEHFGATGATDGAQYPKIADLVQSWRDIAARSQAVVGATSDEQFLDTLPRSDGPHAEKRVLDTMAFLVWHEAYHMGQLGTLRAQFGLTPTATLAVEAGKS